MLNVLKQYCKWVRIQKTYIQFCFKSYMDYKAFRQALYSKCDAAYVIAFFPDDILCLPNSTLVFKMTLYEWMHIVSCGTCGFIPHRVSDSKGKSHLKSIMYVNK